MEQNTTSERAFTTKELKEAGASEAFISLYLSAVDSSAKSELNDGFGGSVLEEGGNPLDVAGGWFTKMWNGQLFWALCHADGQNTAAMKEVFTREMFIRNGVDSENEPMDYVVTMVDQNLDA